MMMVDGGSSSVDGWNDKFDEQADFQVGKQLAQKAATARVAAIGARAPPPTSDGVPRPRGGGKLKGGGRDKQ